MNSFCQRKTVPALLLALILTACGGDKPETMLNSARDYLAKNDNKAAIIQIKNALQVNPNLGEARFLLGKALLDSGDAAAEVELRKALELKQPPEQVVPLLARALLQTGQFKKLVDDLAKTELNSPESKADLLTSLAIAQASLGKADAARAALAAALAAKPDYEQALLVQARMKAATQDFAGAQAVVESVLAKAEKNYEAWKLKGDLQVAQRQIEPAQASYRKALEVRPDFVAAHSSLISLLMQQGKIEEAGKQLEAAKKIAPKNPQLNYLEAQIAYQKKDYKLARDLVQQSLKVAPNNPNVLQLAGAIEFQQKSLIQAEAYLSKAVQAAPDLVLARRLLITTYLRSGQTAKAQAALLPVLDSIDKDAGLLALAGEIAIQSGDTKKAEEYFAKASRLDPQDARKRTSLALAHMMKGDVDTAFSELEAIAAADSKDTTADLALISAYLGRNQIDKALKAIDGLEKKMPDNPLPANLRGQALLAKQDVAGARNSFEKALTINPTYFPAVATLARLDLADKKPDDARKRFEAVIAADPKNTQALLALAELKANTGGTPAEVIALVGKAVQANPNEAAPRLALIDLHLRNKDAKQAVAVAQDAVAAIPDNAQLLDALARSQQAAGDSNQAIATYNKLVALQPTSPLPHMRLADIHLNGKNKDSAIQSLRRALEIKPDLVEAQRGLVVLYVDAGRYPEARAVAREVQKQRPREASGYVLEGDIAAARKNWADAITAYRAGLKQVVAPELAVKLHGSLRASGQEDEANKFAASWLKQQPKDVAFLMYLADLAAAKKEFDKAAAYYRNLLDVQPNNPIALNNLAWVSGQLKNPKAIEYAEKANKLAPNQPAFMDTLAMLLAEKGDTARARELLTQALKLQPQAAAVRLNLAKVLIQAGDKAAARKELEELGKLGDKFPAQAEVAQLLKGL